MEECIRRTYSVCPVCLKVLPAHLEQRSDGIHLVKTCPEHGMFSTIVWRDKVDFRRWIGATAPLDSDRTPPCPDGCGLCAEHQQGTCCLLYEVTRRCNLDCRFCFADPDSAGDVSIERIREDFGRITDKIRPTLQLSGGEPTMRDDLPRIVRMAVEAGFPYVQLNTNGIRLADDEDYVVELADAGLSFVFLQFDGTDDAIYSKLRGRELMATKMRAIENCGKHRLGVTLVPTLVPGVNTDDVGDLIRLAVSLSPVVRGVHFQPVTYLGRYPQAPADDERYTLDELLEDISIQAGDLVPVEEIRQSHCDHPLCGFHSSFIVRDGKLFSSRGEESEVPSGCCCEADEESETCCCGEDSEEDSEPCCCGEDSEEDSEPCCCGEDPEEEPEPCCCQTTAEQNREHIARRWQRPSRGDDAESPSFDTFLADYLEHTFTVTAMAFQDCYNLDIERLKRCSLHVYDDGRIVPFCAYYLTRAAGSHE